MKIIYRNSIDVLMWDIRMGSTAEIYELVVRTERCKGIATDMLNEMISDVRLLGINKIYAFTRKENELAQAFYRKNGFTATKINKFYPDGDAYIYIKTL